MSIQGNKSGAFLFVVLSLLASCANEYERKKNYFESALNEKQELYKQNELFKYVEDTINSWIQMDLKYFHKFKIDATDKAEWKVDEWIFFNSTKDKCLVNVLVRSYYNQTQDDIYFILGEKTAYGWWFYQGPDLVVLQKDYSKEESQTVLPFPTLSEIARKNALSWYYIEKQNEKYLINDQYFEQEINVVLSPTLEERIKSHINIFLKNKYQEDSIL